MFYSAVPSTTWAYFRPAVMVNILSTPGLNNIHSGEWEGKPLKELPADDLLQDLEACPLLVRFRKRNIF